MTPEKRISKEELNRLAEEFSKSLRQAIELKLRGKEGAVRCYSDARTIYNRLFRSLETEGLSKNYEETLSSMKIALHATYKRIERVSATAQPLDTRRLV